MSFDPVVVDRLGDSYLGIIVAQPNRTERVLRATREKIQQELQYFGVNISPEQICRTYYEGVKRGNKRHPVLPNHCKACGGVKSEDSKCSHYKPLLSHIPS